MLDIAVPASIFDYLMLNTNTVYHKHLKKTETLLRQLKHMYSSPGLNKANSIVSRLHSVKLHLLTRRLPQRLVSFIPEHDEVWQGS